MNMADISDGFEAVPVTFTTLLDQDWFASHLVSNFIPAKSILRFAAVCRSCRVVRLTPSLTLEEGGRTWRNDVQCYSPHDWQSIPSTRPLMLHSVFVRCQWKDQGWGNQKGMLSVVRDGGCAPCDYGPWSSDVMCGKEPAPHKWEALTLSYRPTADGEHTYRICARAGGGGGHSLSVKDLVVRAIAIVDSEEARASFRLQFASHCA